MIQRLLQEVKEYKKASLLAPALMVGEVVMELMLPFLMSFIIDSGVNQGDMAAVFKYGALMLLCAFLSLFCGMLSGKYVAYASAGFVKNLRKAMFESIQKFSFANIDKYSTSGLVTRMMTDATNVQNAYQMILRMCVRAPLMLVVAMSMTFMINGKLAMVFFYAMIFLGAILSFITLKAHPMFRKTFRKYDDLNASVQENVTNIRVVKAYVKESAETDKFKTAAGNLKKMFMKAENILVFNNPVMQLTMYCCILALSWMGARMIVGSALTTGELMSLFTYTMNILMSLMMLSMIFVMLSMSMASAQRIAEILEEKPSIVNPENPAMTVADGSIEFDHVAFGYYAGKDKYVLEDINLKIKAGETIGILGPTGSSKSTLMSLIPRLYDASEGTVRVGGVDVRHYDLDSLRNSVAMVLQKNVLFSGTIKDNLRWGNEQATDEEMIHACKLACADEFIRQFPKGYDTYIEQGGTNVSGGQKQRLCIARALLKKPKVLILDDSTSAVDTRTDSMIRKAFREEIPNTTKLIISQRISSIEDADRIVVLNEGRIEGVGTHAELLASNAIYQEVYETQKKGEDEHEQA
ncbi:ABC transporter ATP-binding protein [Holdemania sp. 1001302B_160321_E10]|uniref:ABC transporter ATP-binding protein n=1 Tax=Holdemania sp. 1001302B_160321_E10 TaxID=2787120 RepID=UPI00189A676D|nr:ABC transporter ATP-binding protein [Holdemania sp. 1001302B_160321_E10]